MRFCSLIGRVVECRLLLAGIELSGIRLGDNIDN